MNDSKNNNIPTNSCAKCFAGLQRKRSVGREIIKVLIGFNKTGNNLAVE